MPTRAAAPADPWDQARAIVAHLADAPRFPPRDFEITAYGARPCATVQARAAVSRHAEAEIAIPAPAAFDCQPAIVAAIRACHAAGGGRVVVPAGTWYCAGPIALLSNVRLHLARACRVLFSTDPADFAKDGPYACGSNGRLVVSRWQGNDCLNFSSMVYACGQQNIALTGEDWSSVLDGQGGVRNDHTGASWWDMNGGCAADAARLPSLAEAGVPPEQRVFGLGHRLRPPMVQLIGCTGVLLEGYQIKHAPFWQHHAVNCRDVVLRGVYANSLGPNNDGFDPESCNRVLVEACTFNAGDDCIALKAGKAGDSGYGPSQHVVIRNCTMQRGHGAITVGSETAGGIQHVFAEDLVCENVDIAVRIKTGPDRGGFVRHLYVRNLTAPHGVRTAPGCRRSRSVATEGGAIVTFDCDYAPLANHVRARPPQVDDIHISNVTVGNVEEFGEQVSCYQALVILGPVAPVTNVTITDCDLGTPANHTAPWHVHNVQGLRLKNVRIAGEVVDRELSA